MIAWDIVAAWVLQAVGAAGAIWALFSSETNRRSERTGQRRLTARGWFALIGVLLGLGGFALNQYQAKQRSDADREKAKIETARTGEIQKRLDLVRESQGQIAASENSLISAQKSQILFLTGLAVAQQNLAAVELDWLDDAAIHQKISARVQAVAKETQASARGDDIYFELCLTNGEVILTLRPNYTWLVACRLARPQGVRGFAFDVPVADPKVRLIDAFLDELLSPNLLIQNGKGDAILTSNVSSRPVRVERSAGLYRIIHNLTQTRFSSLAEGQISIRMDATDLRALPKRIRIKSLDPLADSIRNGSRNGV